MKVELHPSMDQMKELALMAGSIMREYFHSDNTREWKSEDGTPFTLADTKINQMVLDFMIENYPGINAIGEEGSHKVENSKYTVTWDPIDGTNAFMVGASVASFCISLLKGGVFLVVMITLSLISPKSLMEGFSKNQQSQYMKLNAMVSPMMKMMTI